MRERMPESRMLVSGQHSAAGELRPAQVGRIAVFLDRDGTLIVDRGYLRDPADAQLLPGAGEAVASLNRAGLPVVVVTNQSGIGRGILSVDDFEAVNQAVWAELQRQGAWYDALYYCPHRPVGGAEACRCRKPAPGLLEAAGVELGFDLGKCYLVGDKATDIRAGQAAACFTILVLTGFGANEVRDLKENAPDFVAEDLRAATDIILSHLA